MLFHVDIVKLINLTLKMISSCDYRGEFNANAEFPKKLRLFQIEENLKELKTCR